ncbi:hypothetical protein [Flavobacterium sp. 25HG05S-40]|uniref:hypothetical protein n=1 Tax=Flavobacterium sp. 25HG05S-40 TaxID=3458682 RepID=UPI0040445B72
MKSIKFFSSLLVLTFVLACSSSNDSGTDCDSLADATDAAQAAYLTATPDNQVTRCNAYKAALQNEIVNCGDEFGDLQAIVDGLNCTASTTTGTLSMSLGSAPISFDEITVTTTGTTRHVHGENSTTTSYIVDFDVEIGQTGANKINNFQLRLLSQTYTPLIPAAFGNNWTNNITVNSSTSIVGTFRGELVNAGQTSVQDMLGGVVDIDF